MMKALIALIEEHGDFARTGLQISNFTLPEFWAGHCFTHSSLLVWRQIFTTSPESCLSALKSWVAKQQVTGVDATKATCLRSFARRQAVAWNLTQGVLTRRKAPEASINSALELARRGAYDDDLDKLISEHDDDIGDSVRTIDNYLVEMCAFVADAIAHEPRAQGAGSKAEGDSMVDSSGDDAAVKFREDLEHDVELLVSTRSDSKWVKEQLEEKEKAFEAEASKPIGTAMSAVVDSFFPMLPFRADDRAICKNLQQDVEERAARIAQIAECEPADVLRVAFFDLSSP